MLLLTCFHALLHRYSGREDLMVGGVIDGRRRAEFENLMGNFTNVVVLRTRPRGEMTFREFLGQVKEVALDAMANGDVPFDVVVRDLHPKRDASYSPFYQVLFSLDPPPHKIDSRWEWEPLGTDTGASKCDLFVALNERHNGMIGRFHYSSDLFDPSTVRRMTGHWLALLESVVSNPGARLRDLTVMTPAETCELLHDRNDTARDLPPLTIHELIERQVKLAPDALAVEAAGVRLTYGELNERANRLARRLQSLGVKLGTLVAVCVGRTIDLIVAPLAVLKAGGAYLPLDPGFPMERLAYMVEDARAPFLLASRELAGQLPPTGAQLLYCDDMESDGSNLDSSANPESLAYVRYTSGSTGKPKGVEISHRALVNLLLSMQREPGFTKADSLLAITTHAFDISDLELYLPLICGGRLVIADRDEVRDSRRLAQRLGESKCTVLQATPSAWRGLIDAGWSGQANLKALCGGEALPRDLAELLLARAGELWNLYGPTETTVWSAVQRVASGSGPVPIGRPIDNTQMYVLDAHQQLVPTQASGELYIGGAGVARGYLRREELMHRFVPNPFRPGERLYRTGDLARWLPDGTLEYLGRVDNQVKIRGFRIEPGEIEAVLSRHPAVGQCVVVCEETPDDKRLVAYFEARAESAPSTSELRAHLKELPEYMVPAAFVRLDKLPLTLNGKIDRKALPASSSQGVAPAENFVAPRTETEKALAAIWAELLNVERVGVNDSFFDLGGHSLLAIRAISRVRDLFGVDLPAQALFESSTIAELAPLIAKPEASATHTAKIPRRQQPGPYPLAAGQEPLWFLGQLAPDSPVYNIVDLIPLDGAYDAEALRKAIRTMVRRHEVLRTAFFYHNGQPMQEVAPTLDVELQEVDLSGLPEVEQEREQLRVVHEEGRKTFDLSQLPLFRGIVIHRSAQEHKLFLVIHHIIADEWALELIHKEIAQLYSAYSRGQSPALKELPIQYADVACWQQQWLHSEKLQMQLAYWKNELAGAPPVLELATDKPRPAVQSFRGATELFQLPENLSPQLKSLCREEHASLFMILEASFAALLHRYTGQDDILVGTPISGRTQSETENLIGYFLNTIILRAQFTEDPSFRELLQQVRERALGAYAHADLAFNRLVAELAPERDLSRTPLFQVMFILHESYGASEVSKVSGIHQLATGTSKFDLTLSISETEHGLEGLIEYSTDLFEASTIRQIGKHYGALLEAIVANPDQCVWQL